MKEINDEVKLTLSLMRDNIDEGAYCELQSHLYSLLEIKRNELQQRLTGVSLTEPALADLPKPLTTEDLLLGGWWCNDTSESALKAFLSLGLNHDGSFYGCFLYEVGSNLLDRGFIHHTDGLKEIHRIGNNFYWSV